MCCIIKHVDYIHIYSCQALHTDTCLIWTPHYYGQFALSLGKESPYVFSKFNPLNTDTPLIWFRQCAY